jgi:hypothetical protein
MLEPLKLNKSFLNGSLGYERGFLKLDFGIEGTEL